MKKLDKNSQEYKIKAEEKKEKISKLRKLLSSLGPDQRQALANKLGLMTVEGRSLSPNNQCLIYFQAYGLLEPSVVGGFKQWKEAGRGVKKGEHGFFIWFPSGKNGDSEGSESEENNSEDGDGKFSRKFYTASVFDISQTEEINKDNQS